MKLINHLEQLVRFETTAAKPGEVANCLKYIQNELKFYPFHISIHESGGKKSLVATSSATKKPRIILAAHIDVVPAPAHLFKLKKSGGKLYGRGVFDMKFAVAVFLMTLKNLSSNMPSIGLMITSDEEVEGNNGPGYLLAKGYAADIALLPDGGEGWKIVEESKGLLQLELTVQGKAGHGARPWEGVNAIEKMSEVIRTIQKLYPHPKKEKWQTTVNFGMIQGGAAINQICPEATVSLDFRFTAKTSVSEILKTLQKHIPKVSIKVIDSMPAFSVDRNNKYLNQWKKIISQTKPVFVKEHGATDGPYFSEHQIPTIISQPIGGGAHTNKEWIDVKSLITYQKYVEEFVKQVTV